MKKLRIFLFCLLATSLKFSQADEDETIPEGTFEQEKEEEVEEEVPRDPLLVSLEEFGDLRGLEDVSSKGRTFYSFMGIPYAKPPVGELRFKKPDYHPGWEGIRNATSLPDPCSQIDLATHLKSSFAQHVGNEDCLYLNIYTPRPHAKRLLPVLVWLHGGAYLAGSTHEYPPHYFMNEDVVLVTVQSRLGVLGYLSTEDEVIPGNFGLKDQTMAFRWISRYIEMFGGDNLKVTLFGNSAGGAQTHFHSLSHHNLGFFRRAIIQSGNALCPWALGGAHREAAFHIGKKLCVPKKKETKIPENIENSEKNVDKGEVFDKKDQTFSNKDENTDQGNLDDELKKEEGEIKDDTTEKYKEEEEMTSEELLECLQNSDVQSLTLSIREFMLWGFHPLLFGPRVDGDFLMGSPEWLLKQKRHKRMELMVGHTRDDGGFHTHVMYANEGRRKLIQQAFPIIGPVSLEFTNDDVAPFNITIKVYDRYNGGIQTENENADNLTRLYTDRHFVIPGETAAFLHYDSNLAKKLPVYLYELHQKVQTPGMRFLDFNQTIGEDWISHTDELPFMFPPVRSPEGSRLSEEDQRISDIIIKMWINFANTGNPTPEGSDLGFTWEPFTRESPRHLKITTQPEMEDDTRNEARQFWNSMPTKQNLFLYQDKFPEIMEYLKTVNKANDTEEESTSQARDEL